MKKLFRFHRGLLADSLETTIEVSGLDELRKIISDSIVWADRDYYKNIRIQKEAHNDPRLPEEWNGISHYVVADFEGYKAQCVGMCNFYEE